ncbi:5-hydroxyisourate hydrolase-like [Engraulis encrasicolus]|uniref:5-hydroxyisourate hydrolase-like n=1 Tax=Engraulis encrasicolus TaxID=184585 RepID=UPI002FD04D32
MDASRACSPVSTHVLNTCDGLPAARMALSLHKVNTNMMIWNLISIGSTDDNGRCAGLVSKEAFSPGMYKLRFEAGQYWESLGQNSLYPYIEVVFTVTDPEQHLHLPLLLTRSSYSTYRGQ